MIRFYGYREIAAGVGIFASQPHPKLWVWARAGGDALDLATLGTAFRAGSPQQKNAFAAVLAVLGITALDMLCGQQLIAPAANPS